MSIEFPSHWISIQWLCSIFHLQRAHLLLHPRLSSADDAAASCIVSVPDKCYPSWVPARSNLSRVIWKPLITLPSNMWTLPLLHDRCRGVPDQVLVRPHRGCCGQTCRPCLGLVSMLAPATTPSQPCCTAPSPFFFTKIDLDKIWFQVTHKLPTINF